MILIILIVALIFFTGITPRSAAGIIIAGLIYIYRLLSKWSKKIRKAKSILEKNQTPESVDELSESTNFKISEPKENFQPVEVERESLEAKRYKTGNFLLA